MCGTAHGWNLSLAQQQNCVDASVVFRVVGDLKENPTFAGWATTVQECQKMGALMCCLQQSSKFWEMWVAIQ